MNVNDVMERYSLSKKAARNLINEAGGFIVGGRLVIRVADLVGWEEARKQERLTVLPEVRRARPLEDYGMDLEEGWWQD